jgi:pimeloyl-ACP methyl ester carboxylesterase
MGGRFALATLEAFSSQIENAFLIAPDGVSEHPLYTFATRFLQPDFYLNGSCSILSIFQVQVSRFSKIWAGEQQFGQVYEAGTQHARKAANDLQFLGSIQAFAFRYTQAHMRKASENHIRIIFFIGKFTSCSKKADVKELADLLPTENYIVLKSGHSQLVEQAGAWICTLFK